MKRVVLGFALAPGMACLMLLAALGAIGGGPYGYLPEMAGIVFPIAYLTAFAFALPLYVWVGRRRPVRLGDCAWGGAAITALPWFFLLLPFTGRANWPFLALGAAAAAPFGLIGGILFWWLAKRGARHCQAAAPAP